MLFFPSYFLFISYLAIITISEESDVAEMIALTFSVAILYSLCQPVPQKERTFVCPKKMVSDRSMEGAALILAAGQYLPNLLFKSLTRA